MEWISFFIGLAAFALMILFQFSELDPGEKIPLTKKKLILICALVTIVCLFATVALRLVDSAPPITSPPSPSDSSSPLPSPSPSQSPGDSPAPPVTPSPIASDAPASGIETAPPISPATPPAFSSPPPAPSDIPPTVSNLRTITAAAPVDVTGYAFYYADADTYVSPVYYSTLTEFYSGPVTTEIPEGTYIFVLIDANNTIQFESAPISLYGDSSTETIYMDYVSPPLVEPIPPKPSLPEPPILDPPYDSPVELRFNFPVTPDDLSQVLSHVTFPDGTIQTHYLDNNGCLYLWMAPGLYKFSFNVPSLGEYGCEITHESKTIAHEISVS